MGDLRFGTRFFLVPIVMMAQKGTERGREGGGEGWGLVTEEGGKDWRIGMYGKVGMDR